jgi:tRNA nucleotidyltransferase (CCA-adding enzyme)
VKLAGGSLEGAGAGSAGGGVDGVASGVAAGAALACALAGADAPERELRRMSARLRAPADCADLALLALRHREQIEQGAKLGSEAIVTLLQACDAWRRPARFEQLLQAAESCSTRRVRPYAAAPRLLTALRAARAVDAGAIAARESEPHKIAARLRAARIAAVSSAPVLC